MYVNEPSVSLWKRLNEVSDRLQEVSEQLVQTNAINQGYHQAFDQQRVLWNENCSRKPSIEGFFT